MKITGKSSAGDAEAERPEGGKSGLPETEALKKLKKTVDKAVLM